jgi:hypothetical protein
MDASLVSKKDYTQAFHLSTILLDKILYQPITGKCPHCSPLVLEVPILVDY